MTQTGLIYTIIDTLGLDETILNINFKPKKKDISQFECSVDANFADNYTKKDM